MGIEFWAALGTVITGVVLPALGLGLWMLRNLVKNEIQQTQDIVNNEVVPQLTNGSTSVASYARQARDMAEKALAVSTTVDARLGRLENKMDAHILGEHGGSLVEQR